MAETHSVEKLGQLSRKPCQPGGNQAARQFRLDMPREFPLGLVVPWNHAGNADEGLKLLIESDDCLVRIAGPRCQPPGKPIHEPADPSAARDGKYGTGAKTVQQPAE